MQGEKPEQDELFYMGSLDALVPRDDMFRRLDELVDLSWLRAETKPLYSGKGRPSIDPVVIAKLLLIAYFEDIRSERKLMRQVQVNLAYRRFIHYRLSEALPDHSALTRSRQRLGADVVRKLFEYVLKLCLDAGLIGGKLLSIDSTFVQANASLDSLEPRGVSQEAAEAARRLMHVLDEAEAEQGEPEAATEPEEAAKPAVVKPEEAGDDHDDQPPAPPKGRFNRNDRLVSRTDPDSGIYSRSHLKTRLGYLVQFAVDCGAQIITAVIATGAQIRDVTQILPLVDQAVRNGVPVEAVVADRGYSAGEVYAGLEKRGLEAFIPPLDHSVSRQGYFGQDAFTYEAESDSYICPQGARLKRQKGERERRYRARPEDCSACPLRGQCTPGTRRSLKISRYEAYLKAAREKQGMRSSRRALRLRRICSERTFAESKGGHGLERARNRGQPNMAIQALLTATVINLKRYLRVQTRVLPQAASARTGVFSASDQYPSTGPDRLLPVSKPLCGA